MTRHGWLAGCLLLAGLLIAARPGPAEGAPAGQAAFTGLIGVAATGPKDAWAVGSFQQTTTNHTLIVHWNGKAWSMVPSPNPAPGNDGLNGVAAVSPSDAWAVGNTGAGRLLILHWNGKSWQEAKSPAVAGGGNLASVSAVSARDVWAVGFGGKKVDHPVIEHFNGISWKALRSPSVAGGASLFSVSARSASDVWAVGQRNRAGAQLIEHWNGKAWKLVPAPRPNIDLDGVAAVSAKDAWAVSGVGAHEIGVGISLIEHWNGVHWRRVASPNPKPGGAFFHGVAAMGSSRAWAVGDDEDFLAGPKTVIAAWDGHAWKLAHGTTTDGALFTVAATSASNVWAVGSGPSQALIFHWNGARWSGLTFSAP